ncbi:carboxylesterase family protein [Erwiniaceae bacterium BAC15a-03b]|uniref:Carboxylic ester hydrolase n=1 Tax=Winslowiella arboricola TaxID=2978220 RepID=A0A9J6PVM7_9GAMM|nr:carboxylesterase family protein [Winslowiella arboricola]MCU5775590.1 carboxylesterase family protein [Winslowiella arboricola]MCU5779560.1 carboxylesterase family protein [Winslowiella arboricola]
MKNEQRLRIKTAEGELRGTMEGELFVFKGIPYAAPPTGPLRWKAPQPVQPWQRVRDAVSWGGSSWQNRAECLAIGGGEPGEFSEDCLYLNVWTPDIQPSHPLPVMVWIHGGGYTIGAGGLAPYLGAPLAARGVVMVTLNYRLGHLGFFAHPALDAEYTHGEEINNFALLDQIAALQWVQRNIHVFGGDRRNVTIMGESSGGRSVLSLFASPLAEGLFHKGIVQSAYSLPDTPRKKALETGKAVARHFNLPDATAEQLRALPADSFWSLTSPLVNGPVAIAGDRVLPQSSVSVFNAARQHKYPLMIGSNSDEASVLEYFAIDAAATIARIRQQHKFAWRLIKWLYDARDDAVLGRQVARDIAFTTMGYVAVMAQHRAGAPGWRYYFDYVSENARDLYTSGTWHGNEVPYVLDTLSNMNLTDRPFTDNDRQFAWRVSEYWLNFARDVTGSSDTIDGEVPWPAWHPRADYTMRFGDQGMAQIGVEKRFMKRRMQVFRLLMRTLVRLN